MNTLLFIATLLLVATAAIHVENATLSLQAPPAGKRIELKTKSLKFAYHFDKDKKLVLESVGSLDAAWTSPLKGPMFASTPCHDENGPRYISPISILTADGGIALDLRYKSHSSETPAPGVEPCQTCAEWMSNGIPLVFTQPCNSAAILVDSKDIPTFPAVK